MTTQIDHRYTPFYYSDGNTTIVTDDVNVPSPYGYTQKVNIPKSWSRKTTTIVSVLTFMIAVIALLPTFRSQKDTDITTRLAQWTSAKDFLEFCTGLVSNG